MSLREGAGSEIEGTSTPQRILDFLTGSGDAVPVHVIASQISISRNTVGKHLRETLMPMGKVEPNQDGRHPTWRAVENKGI